MANSTSWCRTCGREYEVCSHCANVRNYTPWRTVCDTADHYKVWLTVEQYRKGIIGIASAKQQLDAIGVSKDDASSFIPAVGQIVLDILEYSEPAVEPTTESESTGEPVKAKRKGRAK